VKKRELHEFYATLTRNPDTPMAYKFVTGRQSTFKGLLFVSSSPSAERSGISLYVRGTLIEENCGDLVPVLLNFIKGVVDSEDLPLNMTREISQHNKILYTIREELVENCLNLLAKLSEDKEEYNKFYKRFSNNLTLGAYEDRANRIKLSRLLRFNTSASDGELCSLSDIAGRLKPNQTFINFMRPSQIANPDKITELAEQGFEVVYLGEPIDEYVIKKLKFHQSNQLVVFTQKGDSSLELSDGESEVAEALEIEPSPSQPTIPHARILQIGDPGVFMDSTGKLHAEGFVYWACNVSKRSAKPTSTKTYVCVRANSMLCKVLAKVNETGRVLVNGQHKDGPGELTKKFRCDVCGLEFLSAEKEAKHRAIHTAPVSKIIFLNSFSNKWSAPICLFD
jgi:hypothetical protein